jgi:murein DD-endopeptidase MepM/ murein hydrolase activator NlpD
MPEELIYAISGSVGRRSKGAVNNKADIETVQNMLRLAAMIESQPALDPGAIDGTIDANGSESNDDTVKAIETFQTRFLNTPDGVIGVGKRTWNELLTVLEGDETETEPAPATTPSTTPASGGGQFFFPFKQLPSVNWTEGMRAFGSRRSHGARAHAGCDLYFPVGTTIHAIAAGTVTLGPYPFYDGTYALEVDHGTFLARYGEIQKSAMVRQGDRVSAGQPIAKVGKLNSISNSMLHLELYDKSAAGALTAKNAQTKKTASGIPFMRRRDLIDPTAKLNLWKNNRPG